MRIEIEARQVDDVLVIDISGKLTSLSVRNAEESLRKLMEGKYRSFLFNVEKLDYVTSAGLHLIIRLASLLQRRRSELMVCNAKGLVRRAFEIARLQDLIKIFDSEREALLHSLRGRGAHRSN
jgi:anti-anti-sigma factor